MKLQKGRETEKKTANVQMPTCQLPFALIARILGRRIATFFAEFKTGFNLATAMATKHFITEGLMSCHSHKDVAMLDAENPFQALSDNYRARAQSIDLCFAKLVCVSRNWFVFWQTGSCFEKLICVLRNLFVFWETNLCFGKLICVLGNCFVFWEIDLCFGKLFCVLGNCFVFW